MPLTLGQLEEVKKTAATDHPTGGWTTATGPPRGSWGTYVYYNIAPDKSCFSSSCWEHLCVCSLEKPLRPLSPSHVCVCLTPASRWRCDAVVIMFCLMLGFGKGLLLLLACHSDRPWLNWLRMLFLNVTIFILIQTLGLNGHGWFLRQGGDSFVMAL